jgi:hypothetical protein
MELFKEHIDAALSRQGDTRIKAATMLASTALMAAIVAAIVRWGALAAACVALMSLCFAAAVELRLRTNVAFARGRTATVEDALRTAKTGDLVFMRSYHSYDVPEFLFFRCLGALVSEPYFGHVGMLVRDGDGALYLLECTEDNHECVLSGRAKNGVIMHDAARRIRGYDGRVHVVGTSFELAHDRMMRYVEARKHLSFLEEGIGCCSFLQGLLHHCGVMRRRSAMWVPRCSYMLRPSSYLAAVAFDAPVEVV